MTKEERKELELICANARIRCAEAWEVLKATGKIMQTYLHIH